VIDTKEKLLDTAERLFGEQGYGATSLRHIIAEAGVNLASVHYHFGSKEELLDAVVARKMGPINRERLALLDAAEAATAGGPAPIGKLLEAFLKPAIIRAGNDPGFCRLMGRLHGEGLMPRVVAKNFQEIAERFLGRMRRALPQLPDEEAAWRIHFMVGAMAQTLKGPPEYPGMAPGNLADTELLLRRIVTFLSAGFRAPAAQAARTVEVQS
jgi:AcrR family transcriptional regulator